MNKKSLKTQHQVESALFEIMQTKKFTEISITEIAEKAAVSRMSFYRNYADKTEILEKFLEKIYHQFLSDVAKQHLNDLSQFINLYFTYFKNHRKIVSAVIHAGAEGLILKKQTDFFKNFFLERIRPAPPLFNYEIAYYSGAILSTLIYWGRDNYQLPIKDIIAILSKNINVNFKAPTDNHD